MPRFMSEPEAWREIARILEDPNIYATGICAAINRLTCACGECARIRGSTVDRVVSDRMSERVNDHMATLSASKGERRMAYAYPPGQRGPRILAALWLALEAEDSDDAR